MFDIDFCINIWYISRHRSILSIVAAVLQRCAQGSCSDGQFPGMEGACGFRYAGSFVGETSGCPQHKVLDVMGVVAHVQC